MRNIKKLEKNDMWSPLPLKQLQSLLCPAIRTLSTCRQANVASMDTHILGANVKPTINSPTTVEVGKITEVLRRTQNNPKTLQAYTIALGPTTEVGKTTAWSGKQPFLRPQTFSRSRPTSHNRQRSSSPYNTNYNQDNITLNTNDSQTSI